MIDAIAQRYSCLPSAVLDEPISTLKMLNIIALVPDAR